MWRLMTHIVTGKSVTFINTQIAKYRSIFGIIIQRKQFGDGIVYTLPILFKIFQETRMK